MEEEHSKPITPGEVFQQEKWLDKTIEAINERIRKSEPQDQYSFDYDWIAKKCGNYGSNLPKQFLLKLVEVFNQAGWHAWLYENGRDISGVAEDPAFVLDTPDK